MKRRKSPKERALELLKQLNKTEINEVLRSLDIDSMPNTYADVDRFFKRTCPSCDCHETIRREKTGHGLTIYQCKSCDRRFNILSGTPLEKTPYEWKVWVTILEKMLTGQSISTIRGYLVRNGIVGSISEKTVSAMCNKLRNMFIHVPLPKLEGVVQVDEKHFRESQKGTEKPINVLDRSTTRKPHRRATPSRYGTMGPEFATICCAIDSSGHSVAKVVCMGQMDLATFDTYMAPHFGGINFLCSDMNTIYTQWASLNKVNQYVCNSEYHRIIKTCTTKKQLQAWVSFYNYQNNFRADHGYNPPVYEDAEVILIELLKLRFPVTVEDIRTEIDLTQKQPPRYTKKLIAATVAARIKSNNPYVNFTEEDGIWVVDKKRSLSLLPEYKRRMLAKELGIRPFSPTSVSSVDLKKKLLAHPGLEDALYVLANGHTGDNRI